MSSDTSLTLSRTVAADPAAAFAAWTEPDRIREWSAPDVLTVSDVAVDLRVGGAYRIAMRRPDGEVHTAVGAYEVVDPPRRLVYTGSGLADPDRTSDSETRVTVEFRDAGDWRTEVVLTHDRFPGAEQRDAHRMGWDSAMDKYAGLFA